MVRLLLRRSLEGSPSGSISFRMPKKEFENRLCELKEGTRDRVAWDMAMRQNRWRLNGCHPKIYVEVTVSLHGPHDHLMDEQVRYRGGLGGGSLRWGRKQW